MIKLRFISVDSDTRNLVLSGGNSPLLDLTLKSSKTWEKVLIHLEKKWSSIDSLRDILTFFFFDIHGNPKFKILASLASFPVSEILSSHPRILEHSARNIKSSRTLNDNHPIVEIFYQLSSKPYHHLKASDFFTDPQSSQSLKQEKDTNPNISNDFDATDNIMVSSLSNIFGGKLSNSRKTEIIVEDKHLNDYPDDLLFPAGTLSNWNSTNNIDLVSSLNENDKILLSHKVELKEVDPAMTTMNNFGKDLMSNMYEEDSLFRAMNAVEDITNMVDYTLRPKISPALLKSVTFSPVLETKIKFDPIPKIEHQLELVEDQPVVNSHDENQKFSLSKPIRRKTDKKQSSKSTKQLSSKVSNPRWKKEGELKNIKSSLKNFSNTSEYEFCSNFDNDLGIPTHDGFSKLSNFPLNYNEKSSNRQNGTVNDDCNDDISIHSETPFLDSDDEFNVMMALDLDFSKSFQINRSAPSEPILPSDLKCNTVLESFNDNNNNHSNTKKIACKRLFEHIEEAQINNKLTKSENLNGSTTMASETDHDHNVYDLETCKGLVADSVTKSTAHQAETKLINPVANNGLQGRVRKPIISFTNHSGYIVSSFHLDTDLPGEMLSLKGKIVKNSNQDLAIVTSNAKNSVLENISMNKDAPRRSKIRITPTYLGPLEMRHLFLPSSSFT